MKQSAAAIVLSGLVGLGVAVNTPEPDAQALSTADPATGGQLAERFNDAERWAKTFDDPARDAWQIHDFLPRQHFLVYRLNP